jgi:3-(3-hydroxy-phenyl)propionate hydroxylase
MQKCVLISGAGPVGLVSALLLANAGISVKVFEAASSLNMDLRASTFHPPTLDMLARLNLTQKLIPQGLIARYTQQRDRHEGVVAEFDMELLKNDVEHPFRLQCEQWKMAELILEQLLLIPHVQVHFNTSLKSIQQFENEVRVSVSTNGETLTHHGNYLIAADGAWSTARQFIGVEFEGFTYPERFLVISTDFDYAKHLSNLCYVNYCSDPLEWCVLLKVPTLWRVLFPTSEAASDDSVLAESSVQARLQHLLPQLTDYKTYHRTLYKVHQRVAKQFRLHRVFLAGDSAHINNPLGGMGMNGGIHDAHNLCEKIVAVLNENKDDSILDRYERQRRSIAIDYINASTARNKKLLEERDPKIRLQAQSELRSISDDPKRSREYLLKTSMIEALQKAEAIL